MIPAANIPPRPVYPTPEERAALLGFPPGWGVEYANEPWNGRPMRPIVNLDRGPAFTPPVKRHFWERGR